MVSILVSSVFLFVERELAPRDVAQWIKHYVLLTGEQESSAMINIHGVLAKRGGVRLAALPLLIWSSMKFLRTLIRIKNRIWHCPTCNRWRLPLKSL